jgi:sulfite oxidase
MKFSIEQNEGKPGLVPRTDTPENLESPLGAVDTWLVPNNLFYLRNHHAYPAINFENWRLSVGGQIEYSFSLSYQQLLNMPQITIVNNLECAGNKRAFFTPPASGAQWEIGGMGNASWTGVPLSYVLTQAKLLPGVHEILFTGVDSGPRPDTPGNYHFARSMPLKDISMVDPLLALYMNEQILPFKHGFPVRLIVPGWYGMASVKWLSSITALTSEFTGPYQKIDYLYLSKEHDYSRSRPVTTIKVNSVITSPQDQAIIYPGITVIKGIAWAGNTSITQIEVSTDGGVTWAAVSSTSKNPSRFAWVLWEYHWKVYAPGKYTIQVKATDNLGNVQPAKAPWNAKGYGNNCIHAINIHLPKPVRTQS